MRHDTRLANADLYAGQDEERLGIIDVLPIEPRRFLVWALSGIAILVSLSTLAVATIDRDTARYVIQVAYWAVFLGGERNLPTFFSFTLIGFAATLLGLHARLAMLRLDPRWRQWALLFVVFIAMTFDEAAQIHELLTSPMRYLLGADGMFFFAWIIPVAPVVALLALSLVGFLFSLPRWLAGWMFGSGFVYVCGAIGAEMVGASLASAGGSSTLTYNAVLTVEETLEMTGLALFCAALLASLRRRPQPLPV